MMGFVESHNFFAIISNYYVYISLCFDLCDFFVAFFAEVMYNVKINVARTQNYKLL